MLNNVAQKLSTSLNVCMDTTL